MNLPMLYRVVGVRADRTLMAICRGLTMAQAEKVKQVLTESRAFPAIEIEQDDQSAPELDLVPYE